MRRATAPLLCACLTFAALSLLSAAAAAQRAAGPAVSVAEATEPAADTLGAPVGGFAMRGLVLTTAQRRRVRDINRHFYAARVAITRDLPGHGVGDPAVEARVRGNLEDMLRAERAVLTPAQHARFDRNVAQLRASWRPARAARSAAR